MGRVADLMILNILWLLCCIPIVTIGASTSALYYATLKIVRKEDSYPTRMFFHSFKQNLKQGIVFTFIFLVLGLLLFFDIQIVIAIGGTMGKIFTGIFVILAVMLAMTASYTFPVLAQFDNTVKGTLKNSLLMSICHLPYTLVIVILNAIPIVLLVLLPYYFFLTLPLWLFLGIGVIAFLNCKLFVKIFARYMPSEEEEAEETEGNFLDDNTESFLFVKNEETSEENPEDTEGTATADEQTDVEQTDTEQTNIDEN